MAASSSAGSSPVRTVAPSSPSSGQQATASTPTSADRASSAGSAAGGTPTPATAATSARALRISDPVDLPTQVGTEASGLARSETIPGAFWTVGDATGTDTITAVDLSGLLRAEVKVDGMAADNAEAIASAACDGGRCLFVGDIGDNSSQRDHVAVYRMPEPKAGQKTVSAQEWAYTYPDGAHNAESLMVTAHEIVIISKPDG